MRQGAAQPEDPGVVEHDVHPAQLPNSDVDQRLHLFTPGDIRLRSNGNPTLGAQLPRRPDHLRLVNVSHHHAGALGQHSPGDGAAYAPPRPGDHRDLASQPPKSGLSHINPY